MALVLMLFIVAIFVSIFSRDQAPSSPEAASTPNSNPSPVQRTSIHIPYREVEVWDVGKTIVIDPRLRTDSAMRALGAELAEQNSARDFFNVLIYDSERAARLRQSIDQITAKNELLFYDRHFLGTYTKNGTTGFHALEYSLKGFPIGTPTRVNY